MRRHFVGLVPWAIVVLLSVVVWKVLGFPGLLAWIVGALAARSAADDFCEIDSVDGDYDGGFYAHDPGETDDEIDDSPGYLLAVAIAA